MSSFISDRIKVIDKTALYSIAQLLVRALSGPLSILLIAKNLTIDQQAVYYIFISVAAIQWVFELGMSTCLVQVISGEDCQSKTNNYLTFGGVYFLLSSVATLLFTTLYCFWVLGEIKLEAWFIPWLVYITSLAGTILINIVLIAEESTGERKNVYQAKFYSGIFQSTILLSALYLGGGLYALGLGGWAYVVLLSFILRKRVRHVFSLFNKIKKESLRKTFKELIPFQSRTAIVWISGYIYWNFYNIYIYKYISVDFSARFGLVNAALSAVSFAMLAIFQTKRSDISKLIFSNRKNETKEVFANSLIVACIGYIILSLLFVYLSELISISDRLLSGEALWTFITLRFISMLLEFILIYLRCFRFEPLSKITVLSYILIPMSSIMSHVIFGYEGLFIIPIFLHITFLYISFGKAKRFIDNFDGENV
ncbi:hypothetical protein ACVTOH_002772 [Vibrio parahaemolyticus]